MSERAAKQDAEDLMTRLTSLSSAMEGRDSEKELLQHDLKKAQTANCVLRGAPQRARRGRLPRRQRCGPLEACLSDRRRWHSRSACPRRGVPTLAGGRDNGFKRSLRD